MLIKDITFSSVVDIGMLSYIYNYIRDLDNYYPNFEKWYYNKFIVDVMLGNDEACVMKKKGEIIGVALLKKQVDEVKLRAVRVVDKYKKKGYGLYLIDESCKRLDDPLPLCTVSEELINDYSRIFVNRYGFNLSRVERNMYRIGKNEYIFNQK